MKKFIIHISWIFIPLLFIPIANCMIDPSHIYDNYEQTIVSMLQHHRYVINVDPDKDERSLMRLMIDSCNRDVDILVLGSSRVMPISQKMFNNGSTLLNLGVSGATYEDISALLYHFLEKHNKPKYVIIGMDPQFFNRNISDTRWKSLSAEYARYSRDVLHKDVMIDNNFEELSNLFSITYFKQSVVRLWEEETTHHEQMQAIDCDVIAEDIHHGNGICYDGSLIYGRDFENQVITEVNNNARTADYFQWQNYSELSQTEEYRWLKLIRYIRQQGIEIYFFEGAYHPITYHRLLTEHKYAMMAQAMDYINQIALDNNICIIGSYNPADNELNDTDFYDGMHMRIFIIKRFVEKSLLKWETR